MRVEFTFANLCAGIGGFRLGVEPLGAKCVFSSDIDLDCEKTYKYNFGTSFDCYDVHEINASELPILFDA